MCLLSSRRRGVLDNRQPAVDGIIMDEFGSPKEYHILKEHPGGKAVYCGQHGTPEAKQRCYRAIAEWLAAGRQLPGHTGHITVKEVVSRLPCHVTTIQTWVGAERLFPRLTGAGCRPSEADRLVHIGLSS